MLRQTQEPLKNTCTWSCVCVHVYAQILVIEYICTRASSVHSHAHAAQAHTHWTQTSQVHAPRSPCALFLENLWSTHFTTHNLQLYTLFQEFHVFLLSFESMNCSWNNGVQNHQHPQKLAMACLVQIRAESDNHVWLLHHLVQSIFTLVSYIHTASVKSLGR